MGKGASIQIGRRIGSEEGYLRVKDVETNRPSFLRWLFKQWKSCLSVALSRKTCNVLNGMMISANRRSRSKVTPSVESS